MLYVILMFLVNTVYCGARVTQMTRTYNDIAAVTLLLQEVRYVVFPSVGNLCKCLKSG